MSVRLYRAWGVHVEVSVSLSVESIIEGNLPFYGGVGVVLGCHLMRTLRASLVPNVDFDQRHSCGFTGHLSRLAVPVDGHGQVMSVLTFSPRT